jgi:NTP pyrophosphatase (non-canonical NTP hydrolase)
MDFNTYSILASRTAGLGKGLGGGRIPALCYLALGLAGEAGEVANKVKKVYRDDAGTDAIIDELGDVLWYLSETARELGTSLEVVAHLNIKKLEERHLKGGAK